ncbi:MAG: hypothetical protein HC836_37635 [Richelia sp. RM2_1_2]|nr:hypothetical protein [Richelia sp. RM2_1_2]
MRYIELFEATIRNWNQAKIDANSKGLNLDLLGQGNKKYYYLSIPRELYNPLIKSSELPHNIFRKLNVNPFKSLWRISEYPEAVKELEKTLELVKSFTDHNTKQNTLREKFYDWLQAAYEKNDRDTQKLKHSLQLFVPRDTKHSSNPKHKERIEKEKTSRSIYQYNDDGRRVYDDEGNRIKQEDIKGGLLPGKAILRRGSNKPSGTAFWTSTAEKTTSGYWTSEWVELIIRHYPDWYNDLGYIYSIKPSARILVIRDERDAYEVIKNYQLYEGKFIEPERESDYSWHVPWDLLPKHWDAVYVPRPNRAFGYEREIYWFTQDWDVESTVWFDTSVLQKRGEVRIIPQGDTNETY